MQIHATNINGLGASQVVISFLEAAEEVGSLENSIIYLPETGILSQFKLKTGTYKRYKRFLPNAFSRLFECVFSKLIFKNIETIVLGDIPLRGIDNQIVLVHQPNLVYPSVNSFSSKSLTFRVNRFLFSINHKFAKKIIVQTGAMAEDLIKSYPKIKNKVIISPQPVPNWLNKKKKESSSYKDQVKFFYPAAFYPHKKHDFLLKINEYCIVNNLELKNVKIWLTLTEKEFIPYESIKWIENLGRLDSKEMNYYYHKADALLFLSSMESYGLPIIESLTINLPIVVADFSYSRWLCEGNVDYFVPYKENSFIEALNNCKSKIEKGYKPDYMMVMQKFPKSWKVVFFIFQKAIKNDKK
jgi:hypothetical protein